MRSMGVARMEGSKVTSKTSSLKALLLRAWRQRWTDLQWGIQIKTILPRGVSGDVYNLADCILQQALVGSAPNHLVLSYLKHSLSSQLVSYAAVLQRISKYDGFHKPHCIACLLELIESIQEGITSRGKPEEGVLATAILSLTHWLLTVYQNGATATQSFASSISAAAGSSQTDLTDPMTTLFTRPPIILKSLLSCSFIIAMLTLARNDDPDLYEEVVKKCQEITNLLEKDSALSTPVPIQGSLQKLCRLGHRDEWRGDVEPLTYIVQPILVILVTLTPSIDFVHLARRINLVAKLKGYERSRTMSEVMRATLMSLYDALGTGDEIKWGAFAFLRLIHVVAHLSNDASAAYRGEATEEIGAAVAELLEYGPLVDVVDAADSPPVEALLGQLVRSRLITSERLALVASSRIPRSITVEPLPPSGDQCPSGNVAPLTTIIDRAHATLQRVLKTLEADVTKMQDAMFGVLCQTLSGKSFELMLAIACVEGELSLFAERLVHLNEASRVTKPTLVMFDITFLMLAYVVQAFGSKVVFAGEPGNSFFESWAGLCLAERGVARCPDAMVAAADPGVTETILRLASATTPPDWSAAGVPWDSLCQATPAAVRELLVAWEQGALTAADVRRTLDHLKHGVSCLPICAAAWLCAYMQIVDQEALAKPLTMVQQLSVVGSSAEGEGSPSSPPPTDGTRERAHLTAHVVRRIQYDVHLAAHTRPKAHAHSIVSREPLSEELGKVWSSALERGWLSVQGCRQLDSLLCTAGPEWLVTNLVKKALKARYRSELDKAVDLAVAILHLDITTCTGVLLDKLLPDYLHVPSMSKELVHPVCECLARLSVYCVYSALDLERESGESATEEGAERSEDPLAPPAAKAPRLEGEKATTAATARFLRLCNSVVDASTALTQANHFIFTFLRTLTLDNRTTPNILALIPPSLVRGLVRLVPDLFTEELVLSLYDTSTQTGRRHAASDLCLLRNASLKPVI